MKKKVKFHLKTEFTNIFKAQKIEMMKKLLCLTMLVAGFVSINAQSLEDVKKLVDKGDWAGSKKLIDGFLSNEKNAAKPDGWFYKGVIYNECAKKEETKVLCTDCRAEAFEAFKKYQVMDSKNIYMGIENNVRLFDLYNGFFDVAAKAFGSKEYDAAYNNFKNAGLVEDYIKSKGFEYNGFKFSTIDTSLVQNTGLAARLSNKPKEAVESYMKLIDIKMAGPDNLEMYQYVAEYYVKQKDMAGLNAFLVKAKAIYPNEEYWTELELEQVDKSDKKALFAKYDEIVANNPGKYTLAYNYSVELFNYLYVGDTRPADFDAIKPKLDEMIGKALAIKNTADANLLMARHLYNDVYDMQDAVKKVKGTKPEDAKKRVAMKAEINKKADECIKYADAACKLFAALPKLKPIEKANYKNALGIQESMYGFKGDAAKAADYKKQSEAL